MTGGVQGSVVLCGPTDAIGHAINLATGRRGWSHVCMAFACGERHFAVDIDRHLGVVVRPLCDVVTDGRRARALALAPADAQVTLSNAMRLVGRPYDTRAMLGQPRGAWGIYCSAVVWWCLPLHLRAQLPSPPAPADFEAMRCSN